MRYRNYGLDSNPFGGKFSIELECPLHKDYYVTVDGFKDQKPVIDQLFIPDPSNINAVLVSGSTGTGRSSVANYIADRFRPNGPPLKVVKKISDDNFKNAIHSWYNEFISVAEDNNIDLAGTRQQLENLVQQPPFRNDDIAPYGRALRAILKELGANRSLVIIFENVVNHKIFAQLSEILESYLSNYFVLVIFTTVDPQLTEEFRLSRLPNKSKVSLGTLSANDVTELIDQRWNQVLPGVAHPFDLNAIKCVFSVKDFPISGALKALEFIFKEKVATINAEHEWPHDSLKISEREIILSMYKFITR